MRTYKFTLSRGGQEPPIEYEKKEEDLDDREIKLLAGEAINNLSKLPPEAIEIVSDFLDNRRID